MASALVCTVQLTQPLPPREDRSQSMAGRKEQQLESIIKQYGDAVAPPAPVERLPTPPAKVELEVISHVVDGQEISDIRRLKRDKVRRFLRWRCCAVPPPLTIRSKNA